MLGSELVRTTLFGVRNAEKTKDGHIGRAAVFLGQSKNVFDAVKELDNGLAVSAKTASSAIQKACEKDALFKGIHNFTTMCSKNVNPLIWASAGIDVLLAENKADTLVQNAAGIGTMRLSEELMKKCLDKYVDKGFNVIGKSKKIQAVKNSINTKVAKSNFKFLKTVVKHAPNIVKGALFVVGSCISYDVGRNFGNLLLHKDKES